MNGVYQFPYGIAGVFVLCLVPSEIASLIVRDNEPTPPPPKKEKPYCSGILIRGAVYLMQMGIAACMFAELGVKQDN